MTRRWLSGLLVGAALIAAVSGVVAVLQPHVPDLVGLPSMYLLAVLPVAIRWGFGPGAVVAVASGLTFEVLFVPARLTGAIADARSGIPIIVFLLTAVVIAQLAARSRLEKREAARLSQEQAGLRRVATLVAHSAQPQEVFAAVDEEVARLLEPDATTLVRFESDDRGTFLAGTGWGDTGMSVGRVMGVPSSLAPLRSGDVVRLDDFRQSPDMAYVRNRLGLVGIVACPIVVEGRVWGWFGVGSRSGAFPAGTEERLVDFTELIGTAIANAESRSEITRLVEEQAALRRVATLVARARPSEEIFAAVTDEIGRVLGADATVMMRLDEDGGTTVLGETGHPPDEMPVGSRWELDPQLAMAEVLRTGRPARRDDYRTIPGAFADVVRKMQIRSSVAIPISVEGRIWGALGVGTTHQRFPADTERRMAGFTELVGTAIVNAESRAEVTRLLDVQAALRRVAVLVAGEVPPEEIMSTVAAEIGHVLDADALLMTRLDPDGLCTVMAQKGPHPPELHVGNRWALDPDLAMAEAMRTGKPAYRDSYPKLSQPSADYIATMGIWYSVAIPITVDGRVWGALGISRIRPEHFPAGTAERMASFTELLATAVRNTRARAEIVRLLDEQAALRRVATVVARGAPPQDVFAAAAEEVAEILGVDVTFLVREDTATIVAASGWDSAPLGAAAARATQLRGPLERGDTLRLDDITQQSRWVEILEGSGIRALVACPVKVEGRFWGVLSAGSRSGPLPPDAERRLVNFTELVATAIANTASRAEVNQLLEHQAALRRVATLVAREAPPDEVIPAVVEEIGQVFGAEAMHLLRLERDGAATVVAQKGDHPPHMGGGHRFELDPGLAMTEALRTGRPARRDHYDGQIGGRYTEVIRDMRLRAGIAIPILVEGKIWGTLGIATSSEPFPANTEERLASFTELVAMAIGNAENRAQLLGLLAEQGALRRVATLVATGPSPTEVSRAVAEEVRGLLDVDDAGVCRYEPDGTAVLLVGLGENLGRFPAGTRWELDEVASSSEVWRTGDSARFDADRWEHATGPVAAQLRRHGVRSVAATPVVVDGRLWGAVMAWSSRASLPADTEPRMARFTELVAMAIGNAESRAELAASRARIVAASDETRRRIERNLHDGAQQRLVSLGLELRLAQAGVPAELPELGAGIGRIADDLTDVLDELREMARGIHPAMLSEGGLRPALRTLARRASVPVELDLATDARFAQPVEVAAYYVVSEALTNAAKHANASYVSVSLAERDGVLHLSVHDDGVGGADPQGGSGLVGVRDRVEALDGTVEVKSPQGTGTTVLVTLPVSGSRGT